MMTHNTRLAGHFFKNRKLRRGSSSMSGADWLQIFNRRLRTIQFLNLTNDFRHVCAKSYCGHIAY